MYPVCGKLHTYSGSTALPAGLTDRRQLLGATQAIQFGTQVGNLLVAGSDLLVADINLTH